MGWIDLMQQMLHRYSAIAFYLLGSCFFAAYLFTKSQPSALTAEWLMRTVDLPLLFAGMLYGSLGVYGSLHQSEKPSWSLALVVGLPLALVFLLLIVLNFAYPPAI